MERQSPTLLFLSSARTLLLEFRKLFRLCFLKTCYLLVRIFHEYGGRKQMEWKNGRRYNQTVESVGEVVFF
jgi:hypothetical protein